MSGGHFDYAQNRIHQIASEVERLIYTNNDTSLDEYGDTVGHQFSPEVIQEFERGLVVLKIAAVYAQRIDWLVSGDDAEESFLQRLQDELEELK